jgi:hypothetical protein
MREVFKQILLWIRSMLSEPDGTGSSSRTLMLALASLVGAILWRLFDHLNRLTDPVMLGVWLGAVPVIVGSLVAVFLAPYGVNKAGGTVSDIVGSITGLIVKKP